MEMKWEPMSSGKTPTDPELNGRFLVSVLYDSSLVEVECWRFDGKHWYDELGFEYKGIQDGKIIRAWMAPPPVFEG